MENQKFQEDNPNSPQRNLVGRESVRERIHTLNGIELPPANPNPRNGERIIKRRKEASFA